MSDLDLQSTPFLSNPVCLNTLKSHGGICCYVPNSISDCEFLPKYMEIKKQKQNDKKKQQQQHRIKMQIVKLHGSNTFGTMKISSRQG